MARIDQQDARPALDTILTGDELRRWYWRKDELVRHARRLQIKTSLGKFVILERIAHFLDTGETTYPGDKKPETQSRFDWHSEELSGSTVITDSYKNSQNVRRFFTSEIGPDFKFNIAFMEWIRANVGKTLNDACAAYQEIRKLKKTTGYRSDIKTHNQFNQYTRDFLNDNPGLGMDDVRRVWALKIQTPSETGLHVYEESDLTLDAGS